MKLIILLSLKSNFSSQHNNLLISGKLKLNVAIYNVNINEKNEACLLGVINQIGVNPT